MEKINPKYFYVSLDGDGIGKLVGRSILANDVDELHKVSARIDAAQDLILHWCEQNDGIKISGGGDEATMAIPSAAIKKLEDLRNSVEKSFNYTISMGVGKSLSEAGTALLVAKLRGKDRVVYFNKKIKEDIKKAKRRVREGRASQEEYKLSEAYLEKAENMLCDLHKNKVCDLHKSEEGKHAPRTEPNTDDPCPYCADDEDNRTDDCQYCQDLDAEENADGTAGMHDCPACKEYDAENQTTGGIDDCPYCEDMSLEQANPEGTPSEQGAEDHHQCNCPNCPKNDQTNVAVEDMDAEHPDNCPECQEMYAGAIENEPGQTGQEDPNLQGHETAEEVLDMLDQEPGAGAQTPTQEAKKIDNTELPQGDQMKENTSVKENFGDAQKGDVSDSEKELGQQSGQNDESGQDTPDMTDVLQGGLDDHANDQKKQQVLDMVGQTLAGFKANKASLEATKEQNQPLYNSCIQMLKSMIELCKLLGLDPQASSAPQDPGAVAEATQSGAPDGPKSDPLHGKPAPGSPPWAPSPSKPAEGSPDPKAVG